MLKSFLGLVILMGLKKLPSLPDYWSTSSLLGCPELVYRWPYRRFRGVLTCLHLNNNRTMLARQTPTLIVSTKLGLYLKWYERIALKYSPSRNCSIDEAMVGFKGRIGFKQYLPMKPTTRRGYKVWCRADSENGYLCDFRVYTGKQARPVVYQCLLNTLLRLQNRRRRCHKCTQEGRKNKYVQYEWLHPECFHAYHKND